MTIPPRNHLLFFLAFGLCCQLLACGGCTSPEAVCRAESYHKLSGMSRDSIASAPTIEQIGPPVTSASLEKAPILVAFSDDTHAAIQWIAAEDLMIENKVVYSPAKATAIDAKDSTMSYVMRRFQGGSSERVWLGFSSTYCVAPASSGGGRLCHEYSPEEIFVVAEMTCKQRGAR